jgi:hypothetical protein
MTRTWIAAAAAAVLLVGGGVGGYFVGAAGDRHDHRPGWQDQGGGPGFRGDFPGRDRGDFPGRDGGGWDR